MTVFPMNFSRAATLAAALVFSIALAPSAQAGTPAIGTACTHVGTTVMNSDGTTILACLNTASGPKWTVSSSFDLVTAENNVATAILAQTAVLQANAASGTVGKYQISCWGATATLQRCFKVNTTNGKVCSFGSNDGPAANCIP